MDGPSGPSMVKRVASSINRPCRTKRSPVRLRSEDGRPKQRSVERVTGGEGCRLGQCSGVTPEHQALWPWHSSPIPSPADAQRARTAANISRLASFKPQRAASDRSSCGARPRGLTESHVACAASLRVGHTPPTVEPARKLSRRAGPFTGRRLAARLISSCQRAKGESSRLRGCGDTRASEKTSTLTGELLVPLT